MHEILLTNKPVKPCKVHSISAQAAAATSVDRPLVLAVSRLGMELRREEETLPQVLEASADFLLLARAFRAAREARFSRTRFSNAGFREITSSKREDFIFGFQCLRDFRLMLSFFVKFSKSWDASESGLCRSLYNEGTWLWDTESSIDRYSRVNLTASLPEW